MPMMNCKKCGKLINSRAVYCCRCGEKINETSKDGHSIIKNKICCQHQYQNNYQPDEP